MEGPYLQLATCELNHRDEAVDTGGLKLGGDHAIPKLDEPLGCHLVHTERRQARPAIRLERCLGLDGGDLVRAGREHH
jgi:hypothetical protein